MIRKELTLSPFFPLYLWEPQGPFLPGTWPDPGLEARSI